MKTSKTSEKNTFVRRFDLDQRRSLRPQLRVPAQHQTAALRALERWFSERASREESGGLLVLPTGGGKTFSAVRFLCEQPLSEGYKVLWLAHTHHLLEQAFETFGPTSSTAEHPGEVAAIREPRTSLQIRVVSGMPGHARVPSISAEDDVLIGSLQSIAGAHRDDHPSLLAFLESAGEKLFVVFDEAHHAPAPTYARLVRALRAKKKNGLCLLGLTATPVYENKLRAGWLAQLFPQHIIYQTTANMLMASGVLARPVVREFQTHVEAEFDPTDFARWRVGYADIPEKIVEKLAGDARRNDFIIKCYLENRQEFGKTLIFADRWFQCDYLREGLRKHGVKADVVYSRVDASASTVDERNRRTADENTKVIRAFKEGALDVLINVRMLTEGTDVPSVQTVFLTRQTTSRVLLTQMVGRALRGPAFGGTEKAYVVSFLDNWKELINWAEFKIDEGATEDQGPISRKALPVNLISIALVRRLAAQMYRPVTEAPATFVQTLPVGWYRLEFEAQTAERESGSSGDEVEHIDRLMLVYDSDQAGFLALLEQLQREDLGELSDPAAAFDTYRKRVEDWVSMCFGDTMTHMGGDLLVDVFHMARHVAQASGELPAFFPFEDRKMHDLDALAQTHYEKNVGLRELGRIVQAEFERTDRYWRALFPSVDLFRVQYDQAARRVEYLAERGGHGAPLDVMRGVSLPETRIPPEAPEEMKLAVKERDGWRCLCCGSTDKKFLEVDHIVAVHLGGQHKLENLQTLCRRCHKDKGLNEENFRKTSTSILRMHPDFAVRMQPSKPGDREQWARCIRVTLNHYFRCAAVSTVSIGGRGDRFYTWQIVLNPGNAPALLGHHVDGLLAFVQEKRISAGLGAPTAITVECADGSGRQLLAGGIVKTSPQPGEMAPDEIEETAPPEPPEEARKQRRRR